LNALIVYGTSFGATKGTAEEMARILREEHYDIKLVNVQEEKIKDISAYQFIIVGSSLANCLWNSQAEDFLKRFQKDFDHTSLALFVSSVNPIAKREGNTEEMAKLHKIALEDKITKYNLKPIMIGVFGGILNYNKMGFIARKGMEIAFKTRLQTTGFYEVEPGVYDLRDWDEIRSWTRDLVKLCACKNSE